MMLALGLLPLLEVDSISVQSALLVRRSVSTRLRRSLMPVRPPEKLAAFAQPVRRYSVLGFSGTSTYSAEKLVSGRLHVTALAPPWAASVICHLALEGTRRGPLRPMLSFLNQPSGRPSAPVISKPALGRRFGPSLKEASALCRRRSKRVASRSH